MNFINKLTKNPENISFSEQGGRGAWGIGERT